MNPKEKKNLLIVFVYKTQELILILEYARILDNIFNFLKLFHILSISYFPVINYY